MERIKYKALVNNGPGPELHRIETRYIDNISDDEVLMKIHGCGICPGELKVFNGPRRLAGPVVPGHEFYGQVEMIGKNAAKRRGLKVGDFITEEQIVPCGECKFCKSEVNYWMCQKSHIHGFHPVHAEGGMAEYIVLSSKSRIHKLPITKPDPIWIMVEPLGCAIHAVDRANLESDDVVVLAGLGSIGLCMLQIIKMRKPKLIIALDTLDTRLQRGTKFGADVVLNPLKDDVQARVLELTEGYGCDKYINSSGNTKAVSQGLDLLRRLGTYVEFSVFDEPATADWTIIGDRKELTIHGSHLSPHVVPDAINYINTGAVDVRTIVTHTFPLSQYKEAYSLANESKEDCLKVVLLP